MLDSNKNKKKSNRIEALIKNKWFILLCNVCSILSIVLIFVLNNNICKFIFL